MRDPTIWLPPRATAFTEICATCEAQERDRGGLPPTVSGRLRIEDAAGWATCPRGHTTRVLRTRAPPPAHALRSPAVG
jgi:hypothetical protein